MRALIVRHPLGAFVAIAYALSWACWVPLAWSGARVTPGGSTTHFHGLLGPAAAAFIVTAAAEGRAGVWRLLASQVRISSPPLRFLAYALSPLAFLALALAAMAAAGAPLPEPAGFAIYSGLPALSLGWVLLLVLAFNGFGEETGWRGFALERLQARHGPVKGSLLLGLIWAGWHAPSFWFVEGYRQLGLAGLLGGFGLGICAGSVVLARVLNRTGGSLLAAALWHATYNMTSATAASRGAVGAVTTTCVMAWAAILLLQEWRRPVAPSRLAVAAPPSASGQLLPGGPTPSAGPMPSPPAL